MADLREQLENWEQAGLITTDQADSIAAFESLAERRRVSLREIFVYVGGFFVLMAVGFGLQVLWDDLGSLSRVVVVAVPAVILWGVGEALRRRADPLIRGAKVCWMVAAWLTAIVIAVALNEWTALDLEDQWLFVWVSLGALPLAVLALLILPGLPQGLAVVVLAAILNANITSLVAEVWLSPEVRWALYLPWAVAGAVGLAAAEVARRREEGNLVWLFNLVGAWAWLLCDLIVSLQDKLPAWETLLLIESLAIISWSVVRQSRVLLYSGALFLLAYIADINFEYFRDQLGLPAVLLITGIALIAIGLGVDRLRRREATA